MAKRMILMLLALLVVVLALGGGKFLSIRKAMAIGKASAPPPAAVSTLIVKAQEWQPVISSVGSLRAVHGVTVSTDLAGIVSGISFESGASVKKGDMLMQMDTQQEEAQLRSNEARLDLARLDLARKQDLVTKKAIATSDLDNAESELRRATAAVEESKALISRKHITAPFDGVIGIRQVDLGQYINPGAMIAPLQSLDPIYVEFTLPQQNLPAVQLGKSLRVQANGVDTAYEGKITAVDSMIDTATRNVTVQGTIANPGHKLRPGMFATVEVLLDLQNEVIAIPTSAISFAPYGNSVYVIKPATDKESPSPTVVQQQFVKLGPARGDQISVLSGLKAGDQIVNSGVFRLRPNMAVRVNNDTPQPTNELNPKPADT